MGKCDSFVQSAFDLIVYYQSGNDTSLRALFDKARTHSGWEPSNETFWYANARLAFELAGIFEVVESPSSQRWSLAVGNASELPLYGTRSHLSELRNDENQTATISTDDGIHLFRLISRKALLEQSQVMSELLLRTPSHTEIESAVSSRIRGLPDTSRGTWDRFDFTEMRWTRTEKDHVPELGLYRAWERSTGRSVWIVDHQGNSISFISPEWAPLLAAKRIGISPQRIFSYDEGRIVVPRAFKLPRLILKELTLISNDIHIDWRISFSGVAHGNYASFMDVLLKKGLLA